LTVNVKKSDPYLKIAVLGDSGVGKTSLCTRLTKDYFHPGYELTVGLHIHSYVVEVDGRPRRILLYDVAGQPRFGDMLDVFIRGSVGVLLLFDCSSILSFFSLEEVWLPFIKRHLKDIPLVLVENKCDQDSYIEATNRQIETFFHENSKKFNINSHIRVSAKTGSNIEDVIHDIVAAADMQLKISENPFIERTKGPSQHPVSMHTQSLADMMSSHDHIQTSFRNSKVDEN